MIGFKKFIENATFFPGAMVTSSDTGSQAVSTFGYTGHPNHLPDLDMAINDGIFSIPQKTKEGIVKNLFDKEKTIRIILEDGTQMFFSPSQYRMIKGELPIIPHKTKIKVTFQRHGKDLSLNSSNIIHIEASYVGPPNLKDAYKIKRVTYKPIQL